MMEFGLFIILLVFIIAGTVSNIRHARANPPLWAWLGMGCPGAVLAWRAFRR